MTIFEQRQCTALSKRSGERCRRAPMKGIDKCMNHCGRNPARVKANYQVEATARRIAGLSTAEPVSVDAVLEEHLALAGEAKVWRDVLRSMVEELTSVGYESKAGEQTKAAVRLYGEALDRLDKILTNISRLGIEERMATINEQQGQRLQQVLTIAARMLGLDLTDVTIIDAIQAGIAQTEPRPALRGTR